MKRETWDTFREVGMLWWVNRILHTFGWSIVVECDTETGEQVDIYPARTTWLGFSPEANDQGLDRFQKHVRDLELSNDPQQG